MIRFPMQFFSPDGTGGGGDTGGGGTPEPTWHAEYSYFADNPEAVKSFADFKSPDDVFKSYSELRKQQSQPFRLPKDLAKLSDEQRAEFSASLSKLRGVPDAPEGYEFDLPDDVPVDEQGMADFRKLAHERGVDPQTAKDLLGIQVALVQRLNAAREKIIQGMTDNNYKVFKNKDCQGDEKLAGVHMENIKKYLQTFSVDDDGKPDPKQWEAFEKRMFHHDRAIELILLRALAQPAMAAVGTGGSPGSFGKQVMAKSGLYAEMRK